jgi:hypothetical protein
VKVAKSSKQKEFQMLEGMTVFNTSTDVDTRKQPMFFGQPLGLQRYDHYKYPVFDKLTQQQLGYSGDQKRFPFKKIVQIIKHYVLNRNISSLQI